MRRLMSKHSSRGAAWERLRKEILDRDNWICVYCGNEANTADHIVPKAAGGEDIAHNLVAACLKCNGTKRDNIIHRNNWYNKQWLDNL
jgi:5-methylcytosine-specific restriction endonuclease McrA